MKLLFLAAFLINGFPLYAQPLDFRINQYPWAEELTSERVEAFTAQRNKAVGDTLQRSSDFAKLQAYYKKVAQETDALAKEKATVRGEYAYQISKDDEHPQGIYRRTDRASYLQAKKENQFADLKWEVIVDLDQVLKTLKFPKEVSAAAFGGIVCHFDEISKEIPRCLLGFSQSGGDRKVYYEFDMQKKTFPEQAFNFEILGRSRFDWIDQDTLLVSLDGLAYHNSLHPEQLITQEQAIQKNLLTATGYPNQFYLWKRGEPFSLRNLVYQGAPGIQSVYVMSNKLGRASESNSIFVVFESNDGINYNLKLLSQEMTEVPMPQEQDFIGIGDNRDILLKLKKDWQSFKKDDIVSIDFEIQPEGVLFKPAHLVYRLEGNSEVLLSGYLSRGEYGDPTDDQLFITSAKNVSQEVRVLRRGNEGWEMRPFAAPPVNPKYKSTAMWVDREDKSIHMLMDSFLLPTVEYVLRTEDGKDKYEIVDQSREMFDASSHHVEQLWLNQGVDQNGVAIRVPYYIVFDPKKVSLEHNKNPAPTLLYGYGGFGVGMWPSYLGTLGKVWLERGGVYVLANLRGGNEFGDYWHESALKANHQHAFDDFIAIAEDLIRRGITSPQKLAIQGGSNGGLLVGASMTQRPELFKAAISQVPLLDMARYHKLYVGSSWMSEYGDPENAEEDFWRRYSPLHQLKPNVAYPHLFLITSRNDDRVHPAHARKFSQRLEELGVPHLFFEDTKGGHGGTAMTSDEKAFRRAMPVAFLYNQLGISLAPDAFGL